MGEGTNDDPKIYFGYMDILWFCVLRCLVARKKSQFGSTESTVFSSLRFYGYFSKEEYKIEKKMFISKIWKLRMI